MAREAREQDRLATAYVALLAMTERTGQWAQMVYPIDASPDQPVPPLPGLDEQAEVGATISAFGSDEARAAFEAWAMVVREIIAATRLIDFEQAERGRGGNAGEVGRIYLRLQDELRPRERETREELGQQVRKELRTARQQQ
jgi:hypothetical protein